MTYILHNIKLCVLQALIEYTVNDNLCGGTLVRPDWVVTAAHCLYSSKYDRFSPSDLTVRIGVHNRSATEHHQQLLQVRDRYVGDCQKRKF